MGDPPPGGAGHPCAAILAQVSRALADKKHMGINKIMDCVAEVEVSWLPDALRRDPWCAGVTEEGVELALATGNLRSAPILTVSVFKTEPASVHEARIAWFVEQGWRDTIQLDVGAPDLGCHVGWIVEDGNHRLAAAIYRGDKTIDCTIGGDLCYADELLGTQVSERWAD